MKRIVCLCVGLLVALSVSSMAAKKWTAEKVVQKIIASYEKQMEKINDMTTITDKYTLYQKKAKVKEKSFYKSRMEMEIRGKKYISIYDGSYAWSKGPSGVVRKVKISYDPYQTWRNLASADAEYKGTEKIDGHNCHVLAIDDMRKILSPKETKERVEGKYTGKIWVDAKDWMIRRMEMVAKGGGKEGEKVIMKQTHKLSDYRKVKGLWVAYRQAMTMYIGEKELSDKERKEIEEGIEEMKKSFKDAPQDQKDIMENIIMPQIEAMKKLLGEEVITQVKNVKSNTGLRDHLFDGSRLKPKEKAKEAK